MDTTGSISSLDSTVDLCVILLFRPIESAMFLKSYGGNLQNAMGAIHVLCLIRYQRMTYMALHVDC